MRVTTHGKIADKHRKRTLSVCVAVTSLSHDDYSNFADSVCIHNTQSERVGVYLWFLPYLFFMRGFL